MELFLMSLVLLAEDDSRLANLVKDYLNNHGYGVGVESAGVSVVRKVKDLNPDIVILDIMLPGKDGLTICKELRPQYPGPILMLTARNADMDQVLGLEFGADDYVIKPAEPRVLLARIRALLRRYQHVEEELEDSLEVGALKIEVRSRRVLLYDSHVALSCHEFDLLFALARQAGKVLSREFLFTTVYDRPYDGLDRTIDVRVSQLRKKLGDTAIQAERIKTIWGKGYLFVSEAW